MAFSIIYTTAIAFCWSIGTTTSAQLGKLQPSPSTHLTSPATVTATVGTPVIVFCSESGGTAQWYGPDGGVVSSRGDVRQAGNSSVRQLVFASYQLSQGGQYQCRTSKNGTNSTLYVTFGPTTPLTPPPTCGFGIFNCTSGGCISSLYVCDGTQDCDDGSDELYCGPTCLPREFLCEASNVCVLESWKCDGEVDCMEGEDEVGCSKENCTRSQFDCVDKCIPFSQRCDGRKQCDSGADEFNCSEIRCTANEYQCRFILECISGEKICDRVTDCYDGTDETGCSRSVTTCDDNHGCEQLCVETKNSFYCACNPGYQLNRFDGRSCIDIDECATPGMCTQLCHNSAGNYSCECVDGYTLLGGGYCKAGGDPAYLLYASLHSISRVNFSETRMFSGPSTVVIHNQPLISGIDYDLRANKLYWGDLQVDTIMRSNLDGSNKETFTIPGSVYAPAGVAVDWVTGNVYWIDSEKKTIEVSDKSGQHRKILVWENLHKPRGLVLDPTTRLMYWTDWGDSPKIEHASMDGSNRAVLHNTRIHWPNAIALDIPTQTLYWADPWYQSLQSSHVNGTNRQPVIPHGVNHAYDMTLFQDTVYWSDWASKSIYRGHKYSSASPRHVQSTSLYPMGLKVVHVTLQPMVENPCSHNNSGCSQLCLLSSADTSRTSSCACALGYILQPNGRSCEEVDTFLIVAQMTSVLTIPLYQKTLPFFEIHLPLGTMKGVSDVAWDSQNNLVFWTDKILHTISVSHISGKNSKQLFSDDLLVPEGITYNWLTKKIYWVDRGYQRIEVADITGENRAVLVSTGLNQPRGIAVHPYQGYLYWTDWGRHPKIERMNLDGTNRITVVDLIINNETHMPNHMDIDFETNRIYWVEYNYARIMYANLDGAQITKVGVDLSRKHPIGLAVHGDYVYWSNTERIKRTRKTVQDSFRYDVITTDLPMSLGMEVFHRNRTIGTKIEGVTVSRTVHGSSPALRVSWSAVSGSGITYTVCYSRSSGTQSDPPSGADCSTSGITGTSTTLGSLSGGTTYYIWVSAVSSGGQGAYSDRQQARTHNVPSKVGPPFLTKAASSGKPALTVTWTIPQSDRPITQFQVQYRRNGATSWLTKDVTSRPATLENLTAGISYQVRVKAVSDVGTGPYSDVRTITTYRVPSKVGPPTLTKATRSGRPALTLTWTAPSSDRPITKYQVQYRRSATAWITKDVTSRSATLENLSAGISYQVRVRAVSDVGTGPYSDVRTIATYRVPSKVSRRPVLNQTEISKKPALTVTWTAPVSERNIIRYQVKYRRSGTISWSTKDVTSTSTTLENLSAGTSYQVRVRAVSDVGAGPYSDVGTLSTYQDCCLHYISTRATMFVLFEMERTKVSESETVLMVDVYRHGPMKNPLFLKVKDVPGNAIRFNDYYLQTNDLVFINTGQMVEKTTVIVKINNDNIPEEGPPESFKLVAYSPVPVDNVVFSVSELTVSIVDDD